VSAGCKCRFSPLEEVNNAPAANPLAGFEGPLQGGGKRGEREGREGGNGWKEWEKTVPSSPSFSHEINF